MSDFQLFASSTKMGGGWIPFSSSFPFPTFKTHEEGITHCRKLAGPWPSHFRKDLTWNAMFFCLRRENPGPREIVPETEFIHVILGSKLSGNVPSTSTWNGKCPACGKGTYLGFTSFEHEGGACSAR